MMHSSFALKEIQMDGVRKQPFCKFWHGPDDDSRPETQARLMAQLLQPPTCSLDSSEGCLEVQPHFLSAML